MQEEVEGRDSSSSIWERGERSMRKREEDKAATRGGGWDWSKRWSSIPRPFQLQCTWPFLLRVPMAHSGTRALNRVHLSLFGEIREAVAAVRRSSEPATKAPFCCCYAFYLLSSLLLSPIIQFFSSCSIYYLVGVRSIPCLISRASFLTCPLASSRGLRTHPWFESISLWATAKTSSRSPRANKIAKLPIRNSTPLCFPKVYDPYIYHTFFVLSQ